VTYSEICGAVEKLKKKYEESDPFRLCRRMDIKLLYNQFGKEEDSIKGFFLECKRVKTITLNSDLPSVIQRIVLTHELGHAVLHENCGIHAFHEVGLFNESSEYEKDANLFAAEFLLKDEDVLESLNAETTFFSAASRLVVPMELLDFKLRVMRWKGYKSIEPPITAQSNFLRNLEVPDNADYYD